MQHFREDDFEFVQESALARASRYMGSNAMVAALTRHLCRILGISMLSHEDVGIGHMQATERMRKPYAIDRGMPPGIIR